MNEKKAMYYIMTGETFDGRKAAELGIVTEAVPREKLRERTVEVAKTLMAKSPTALRQAKANDVVLIAGKGHEKEQILAGRTIPFDDAEVALSALAEMGYGEKR